MRAGRHGRLAARLSAGAAALGLLAGAGPAAADAVTFHSALGAHRSLAGAERFVVQLAAPGCPACPERAARRLGALAGAKSATLDPAGRSVTLVLRKDGAVAEAALRRAVEAAGARWRGVRALGPAGTTSQGQNGHR
ncbi:MAG: heavy-metal-associated domain-containing protein [Gammaproteobacteria bacterium]|uniref:Heavy-metal-associated domain-containing protein n=1 Tax=Candidatus Kutchimonas denitrificans TaxID=3056748 RepID=A0AAE5C7U0_9BACT|nr:heavy-metal-associated domain-containing protein [Gammaproteobacteria bacterium]NIR73831.1 heavy-metal-associated domain-containing protein [Candidatus Kutchimonas denitrificans]